MQSKERREKLKLAQSLLNNEPEPRPMRAFRVVDGKCSDPDYPANVLEGDLVIHVHIIKENPEMINPVKG
jgi:hypothetical protein